MMSVEKSSIRQHILVEVPVERAFEVFTRQFDRIKPSEHNLLSVPIAETVFETRAGGAVYDRGVDGSECRWARVLAFEPPTRLVISWDISPAWTLEQDLDRTSEVEVRSVAQGPERTRVELEHRHLDRHGDGWPAARDVLGGEQGWPVYLHGFAEAVAARAGDS